MKFLIGAVLCLVFLSPLTAQAVITITGDVDPSDPDTWTSSIDVYVGKTAGGSLRIDDGSSISAQNTYLGYESGATGTATVSGVDSGFGNLLGLSVGYEGNGELNIINGGVVNAGNYGCGIGCLLGSTGIVNVSGAGSSLQSSQSPISIGDGGTGELNITNGGVVDSRASYNPTRIGCQSGSMGTVNVSGKESTWTGMPDIFYIGFNGTGVMNITDGGTVEASFFSNETSVYIGTNSGSTGTASISGANSTWSNIKNLNVGYEGTGILNISDDATLYVKNVAQIGALGSIHLDNGTMNTKVLYADFNHLTGNGTINTSGLVADDLDLLFDATHGLQQTFILDSSGRDIAINLNQRGTSDLGAGHMGNGTLIISEGVTVESQNGYLGNHLGSVGTATVSGTGSTWTNNSSLYVGNKGTGVLNIADGGTVSSSSLYVGKDGSGQLNITNGGTMNVQGQAWVAYGAGASGSIHFDNGTLTTGSFYSDFRHLTGTGAINTNGLVTSNVNLNFDATHSSQQTLLLNKEGQNIAINLDQNSSGDLGAGYAGYSTLSILDGVTVESNNGYLGYNAGSIGTGIVSGTDSQWNMNNRLCVGLTGSGTLNIIDGGTVNSGYGSIGSNSGSIGTVTVSGCDSTWTNSGGLSVGYRGTGILNIINGGTVNSSSGLICFTSTQGENLATGIVTVSGIGSKWINSGDLKIGSNSYDEGILNVTNGGAVSNINGYIGGGYGGSSSSTVNVSGAESTWTNSGSLSIGYSCTGFLNIANGASVYSDDGCIGYAARSAGTATISGPNSTWENSGDLYVGREGVGVLNINYYGSLSNSGNTYIGNRRGSTGMATVSGTNSTWANYGDIYIGKVGTGILSITNGGSVNNSGNAYIGYGAISVWGSGYSGLAISTGTVTVSGPGSAWTNSGDLCVGNEGSGVLNITDLAVVNIGGKTSTGIDGAIHLNNGTLNSGSLYTGSSQLTGSGTVNTNGLTMDGIDLIFDATHGLQQTLNLNGQNQDIVVNLDQNSTGDLVAGYTVTGTLTIRDGLVVGSCDGYVGYKSDSTGIATVSGAGSTWTNSGDLYVGHLGSGELSITDGGAVSAEGTTWVAYDSDSSGSIHFDNSTLTTGLLYAGASQLTGTGTINTNSVIADGVDLVFDTTHSFQQTLTLNGDGQNIVVNLDYNEPSVLGAGYTGRGTLTIQDGINAASDVGYIGYKSGSAGTVTVSGAGSTWTNYGELHIGKMGNGELNVSDAGIASSAGCYIGYESGSAGVVNVAGMGANWTNNGIFYVGYSGDGQLNIRNGGTVNTFGNVSLGYIYGSKGVVTVSGNSSMWTNEGNLYFGNQANDSELHIADGGIVINSGFCSFNSYSLATVSGHGSMWTNGHRFDVYGRLDITDGGTVISLLESTVNGTLNVSGDGSTCDNQSLRIGYNSTGEMNVTDGATVNSYSKTYIGYGDPNQVGTGIVTVSGNGSTWTNGNDLFVGSRGTGKLSITDGGLVSVAEYLRIAYTGGDCGSFVNMASGGMLALDGKRDYSLESFFGHVTGSDAIRWWNEVEYEWAPLETATMGTDYTLEYLEEGDLAGYTLLTVLAAGPVLVAGDVNFDGKVDGSDVTILAGNWQVGVDDGQTATRAMGDLNEDGRVDGADVTILAGNWQYGVDAATSAVPEPSVVALVLTALLAFVGGAIRKRG